MESKRLNFEAMVEAIRKVHDHLANRAVKAVNASLTLRNWIIGCYIREYELGGSDRAAYGERLLEKLSARLQKLSIRRAETRELRRYRQFYLAYPQIREALTPEFIAMLPAPAEVHHIRESLAHELTTDGKTIVEKLSFTHLAELLKLDNPLKRVFYEIECIRGNWSVRELKRQIASLYYERSGLSEDKARLSKLVQSGAETDHPKLVIRDPYIFEFLGLKSAAKTHSNRR